MLIDRSVSLSMRRPNMLRFTPWVDECMEVLDSSCAAKSDKLLFAWVKLLKITEEIGTSFSFDDIGSIGSLSEYRIQVLLKSFEKALNAWERDLPSDVMNGQFIR